MCPSNITTIAYYLGQFHPLEENNKFWGEGFTEWHNVAKARPLFIGHNQPVLPGRFGFYDLRLDDILLEQSKYANEIGVDVFCYWHYWFAGKRVLHKPLDKMLSLPNFKTKVMLGWANESWTGIWHGLSKEIIFKQTYNRNELQNHAKLIASYVNSNMYLKINNVSPFLIYKPLLIPDAKNYLNEMRELVRKEGGGDLYIIGNWGPGSNEQINRPINFGLDAVVANNVGRYFNSAFSRKFNNGLWHVLNKIGIGPQIRDYKSTSETLLAAFAKVDGVIHATAVAGWDNTPRSGRRGLVLSGFNEQSFRKALNLALTLENRNKNKLLFLKSWNEWAEGNTLEPIFKSSWDRGNVLKEFTKIN